MFLNCLPLHAGTTVACFSFFTHRLQSLRRDVALQELDVLDEVRRNFLHHQQQVKNVELQRLDDELNRKVSSAFLSFILSSPD